MKHTSFVFVNTYTVGTYSPGKLSVVYEINMQVLPTVPSPTTTHLIGRPEDIITIWFLLERHRKLNKSNLDPSGLGRI